MSRSARIPRKKKKALTKLGVIKFGMSMWHCLICQKRYNGYGYDQYFCKKCDDDVIDDLIEEISKGK